MSDSLSSLFKKEPPWANRSRRVFTKEQPGENRSRRSIKKYVSDSLVIRSFALKIRAIRSKKLVLFTMFFTFFTAFPLLCPIANRFRPSLFTKERPWENHSRRCLKKKERPWSIRFQEQIAILRFRSQKRAIGSKIQPCREISSKIFHLSTLKYKFLKDQDACRTVSHVCLLSS